MIQQISSMMGSLAPPEKTKSKPKRKRRDEKNDEHDQLYDDLLKGWS